MDRAQFTSLCDQKIKLIRTEYSYTQQKMSYMLGISKKTLIEIEKGRSTLGWTGSVALCAIFRDSEILGVSFGGRAVELMLELAFGGDASESPHNRTAGSIFWQTIQEKDGRRIQLHMISQHYRLIDSDGKHIASSFNIEDLEIAEE